VCVCAQECYFFEVMLPGMSVEDRECYKLVSEQEICFQYGVSWPFKWLGKLQNGIRAMVSTLSLDEPCNWMLNKKFWKGIVVEMEKIQVQIHGFNIEPGWPRTRNLE
jgi:hypothetical protein